MGKGKKKKEKKADFVVAHPGVLLANCLENQVESRQVKAQASQLYRYIVQVAEYNSQENHCLIYVGIALPNQSLDNAFLEGEARRTAAFAHQLTMTKHYAENQRKGSRFSVNKGTNFQMR
jgi:hypothetical protein